MQAVRHSQKKKKKKKAQRHPDLLRNLYAGQGETELDMEKWTGSKLGKEYVNAVFSHLAHLTYM